CLLAHFLKSRIRAAGKSSLLSRFAYQRGTFRVRNSRPCPRILSVLRCPDTPSPKVPLSPAVEENRWVEDRPFRAAKGVSQMARFSPGGSCDTLLGIEVFLIGESHLIWPPWLKPDIQRFFSTALKRPSSTVFRASAPGGEFGLISANQVSFLLSAVRFTQSLFQILLHLRPFRRDNRIPYRVARNEICRHAMRAQNAFHLPSDALNRGPRSLVAHIGVQAHAKDLPGFKGVGQHQQLGFSIRRRADGRMRQPRVADLTRIGSLAPVLSMSRRPGPALQIEKPRGSDDSAGRVVHNHKRQRGSGISPRKRRLDVRSRLLLALRNRAPAI